MQQKDYKGYGIKTKLLILYCGDNHAKINILEEVKI